MGNRVLTIGRLDSTGQSGILRDVSTIAEIGGGPSKAVASFCMSAVEPRQIFPLPIELVCQQINDLIDGSVACIKVGSLVGSDMMNKIADFIEGPAKGIPLVLEPVISSGRKSGLVLDHEAIQAFERRLFFYASLLCPNLTEAYRITGVRVTDIESMRYVAQMLMTLGNRAVLLTGGSLAGDTIYDVFLDDDQEEVFETPRILYRSPEGTGDALTASIAHYIAQGLPVQQAVAEGRNYVRSKLEAIANEEKIKTAG
jgi:hydroxymethylpyrimidine/phosphomethylpyrimidine kinase